MNFEHLIKDDKAVSPVIGVILMVAITVILAAVIGTFVLGLGNNLQSTTPQASFGFDTTTDAAGNVGAVTATHQSGASIPVSAVSITSTANIAPSDNQASGSASLTWNTVTGNTGDITAGSSATVYAPDGQSLNGATIRVVYNSAESDSSSTLGTFEVPQ